MCNGAVYISGKRVWLEIIDYDIDQESAILEIDLGDGPPIRPFQTPGLLGDGAFLSTRETLMLRLRTGTNPIGTGFAAVYKSGNIILYAQSFRIHSKFLRL